jgi:hypothetical protein
MRYEDSIGCSGQRNERSRIRPVSAKVTDRANTAGCAFSHQGPRDQVTALAFGPDGQLFSGFTDRPGVDLQGRQATS